MRCGRRSTPGWVEVVEPRTRLMAFGSAAGVVVAGGVFGLFVGGFVGGLLAISCVTIGLGAALLLLFLEVALSEDRDRETERERRRERDRRVHEPRWRRRPG